MAGNHGPTPYNLYAEDKRTPLSLKQKLQEMYDGRAQVLVQGAAKSFEDYREKVGALHMLKEAILLCEEFAKTHAD